MAQKAPGRADREGISLLEFIDIVPTGDAARILRLQILQGCTRSRSGSRGTP